ncbi:MAG: Hsp20/alpha crystallin family protein [Halobacteriaceae archaeon]
MTGTERGAAGLGKAVGRAALKRLGRLSGRIQEERPLAVDVLESESEYLLVFDAPGATASDVQVRYVEDEVRVQVDRFRELHDGFDLVVPGRGLALDGRALLPDDAVVDPEAARAELTADGTLRVFLPKADVHEVPVESGDAGDVEGGDAGDD